MSKQSQHTYKCCSDGTLSSCGMEPARPLAPKSLHAEVFSATDGAAYKNASVGKSSGDSTPFNSLGNCVTSLRATATLNCSVKTLKFLHPAHRAVCGALNLAGVVTLKRGEVCGTQWQRAIGAAHWWFRHERAAVFCNIKSFT